MQSFAKFITTNCSLFVVVHLSGLFGEKERRRLYDQIQSKQLERKGQCKVEMVIANQVDQKDAVQTIFKVTVSGSQDRARRSSRPFWRRRRRRRGGGGGGGRKPQQEALGRQ